MRVSRTGVTRYGVLVAIALSVCATFAQASPDKSGMLLPEKPIVLNVTAFDVATIAVNSSDQIEASLAAIPNFRVVSLDNERQMDSLIASAVLETNATLAYKEATLTARLINEVGWRK